MQLEENLAKIQSRIAEACQRAGRATQDVQLMAVSKGQPPSVVQEAARLGLTLFGENKVQEGKSKVGLSPSHLKWHMIGHLQSNKCRDAIYFFHMIQSVDSFELAEELNRQADKSAKDVAVLLEVNIAGEASKFGFKPQDVVENLMRINDFPRLIVSGLMTIAPWSQDPERVRPMFRQMAELKAECESRLGAPLPHLSMGMSGDFEVAIEEGSTLVRIGTSLFGARPKPAKQ